MSDNTDWKALLLSWDGRLRRSHFWIGMVAIAIVNMIAGAIPVAGAVVSLILIAPAASIAARRLHDMGRSAKFALVPVASSVAAGLVGMVASLAPATLGVAGAMGVLAVAGPALLLLAVLLVINLAFVLWAGLSAGVRGPNAFGPDPRLAEDILPGGR